MVTCAPIACKHKVSGSLSLPSRGSFHLSLTVLCAIGSWQVFSLGRWSSRIRTGFLVSRPTQVSAAQTSPFNLRGSHPLWRAFPDAPATEMFSQTVRGHAHDPMQILQPRRAATVCTLALLRFGLLPVRSPLLGESFLFSSPPGT